MTKAVAALRLTAALPSLTKFLQDEKSIRAVSGQVRYLPESTETTEYLDFRGTARTNGVKASTIKDYTKEWEETETGHWNNILASREGASVVADACVAGPS